MATLLTATPQEVDSSDNGVFRQSLWAWYSNQSGSTATVNVELRITNILGQDYSGKNKRWAFNTSRGGYDSENPWTAYVYDGQTITVKEWSSKSVSGGSTIQVVSEFYSYVGGTCNNNVEIELPVFGSAPSDGYIHDLVAGTESFTGTFGVGSVGVGGTGLGIEAMILSAPNTGPGIPQRFTDWSGEAEQRVTIDNNSEDANGGITLAPNNHYYAGLLANNGIGQYRYDYPGGVYTLAPTPTALSVSSQTHHRFNKADVTLNFTVPSDGGALDKTLYYRYSTDGGTTFTDWTSSTTIVSGGSQTTGTLHAFVPTDSEIVLEICSYTEAGLSGSISTSFTSIATHQSPVVGNWTFVDSNVDVTTITGSNQIFIQGKSIPVMSIDSSEISTYSGTTISRVYGLFDNTEVDATYSSPIYRVEFSNPTSSGELVGTLNVEDSLGATSSPTTTRMVLPYSDPTISGRYNRIDSVGRSRVVYSGEWSPLTISGENKNTLRVEYRLVDKDGEVIGWTEISPTISEGNFSGEIDNLPTSYAEEYFVELRVIDSFITKTFRIDISAYEKERFLIGPKYDIEIWTRDNIFVADITRFVEGDLSMTWQLNDIEEISFKVNLDKIEELQNEQVYLKDLFIPYAHDVRVRRNGKYILGCQIVDLQIQIQEEKNTVTVKGTGYLNIFKDQYISMPLAGYPYPKIAHKLLTLAQNPDCLIMNPTGDIDASYWLSDNSSIAQTSQSYAGVGAIQAVSSQTFTTMATQMRVKAGEKILINVQVSGQGGTPITFVERELINKYDNQVVIGSITPTEDNTYTQFEIEYEATFENGYLYIQQQQNTIPLRADNIFVYSKDDDSAYYNQYVSTIYSGIDDTEDGNGHNYADEGYLSMREFDYELQNVKDALIDLTKMGDDYFEFEFTPDKIFNTYTRKGSDRTDIELTYPGNVYTANASLSASDMANKVQVIGSGIGDERLEVWATDNESREVFGNRETVQTENNVSITETLQEMADGELLERGPLQRELSVVITDGSLSIDNLQTGDSLIFRVDTYFGIATPTLTMLEDFEGWYRIQKIQVTVDNNGAEKMNLTLKSEGGFTDES